MCGIAGCFAPGGDAAAVADAVGRVTAALAHRGPDASGAWSTARCALGHRRLAIQDLSAAGAQPMHAARGEVLVYNGEIYNAPALREELVRAGHAFRGHSDTEVLLQACVEWGVEDAVLRLDGIFAFALWEPGGSTLWLARDPLGVKPLYHGRDVAGRTWFASELAPLMVHAPLDRHVDPEALGAYAVLGFVPGPETLYRGARALPPGGVLRVAAGRERLTVHGIPPAERPPDYASAVRALDERLGAAVAAQLVSDVPLGAFLSGGLDSSAIAAFVTRRARRELATFSIGYDDDPVLDETRWAELVAKHLGTRHTTFHVRLDDVREALGPALGAQGQPFADPSLLPSWLVARLARAHVTVALSGDGADELFAGYRKYLVETQRARVPASGWSLRAAAFGLGLLPATRRHRFGDNVRRWRKAARAAALPAPERWVALQAVLAPPARALALLRSGTARAGRLAERVAAAAGDDADRDGLATMLRLDGAITLPDRMLYKVDSASMQHGLEVRVPLLGREVVALAAACPASWKLHGTVRKRLLRDVALPELPSEMAQRPKQGFDVPIGRWLAGPLKEPFFDLVRSARPAQLIDGDRVLRLHAAHVAEREAADAALWSIFCLAWWAEHKPFDL